MPEFIEVDPGELYLPPSREDGADSAKLARQLTQFGDSTAGMPALQVTRGKHGFLRINDGVTRATRVAKLHPGKLVLVEVIHERPTLDVARMPKIRERLP